MKCQGIPKILTIHPEADVNVCQCLRTMNVMTKSQTPSYEMIVDQGKNT